VANWKVEERLTGNVVYAYGADAPDHFDLYPLDTYNHTLVPDVASPPPERIITKLEYLRRFTSNERIAIRTAALSNAVLNDYMALLELAQEVNLDDPDTVSACQMLEQAGLIGAGRAAEILA